MDISRHEHQYDAGATEKITAFWDQGAAVGIYEARQKMRNENQDK